MHIARIAVKNHRGVTVAPVLRNPVVKDLGGWVCPGDKVTAQSDFQWS